MHSAAPPFAHTSGPRHARVAIVGEAWGQQEALVGLPFVGATGQELTRLLRESGFSRQDCFLTNALALRPLNNSMDALCGSKAEVGANYSHAPLRQGKYLLPEYLPEIDRLHVELAEVRPNLCIAMGATACWALLGTPAIGAVRGTVAYAKRIPTLKVLPTYHPAALFRNWALRVIVLADLSKAAREQGFPEIRRPQRLHTINPTLAEARAWIAENIPGAERVAIDIETIPSHRLISCVGFATSPRRSLVIRFLDEARPGGSFWPTLEDEVAAWGLVESITGDPRTVKIFQNGMYDIQWLWRMGIKICMGPGGGEDTMLLHHSMYPELLKGLGFLGSIYTDEISWKIMHRRAEKKGDKKDE